MESQWLMLIGATIILPVAMFYVGYWLEGQSDIRSTVSKGSNSDSD